MNAARAKRFSGEGRNHHVLDIRTADRQFKALILGIVNYRASIRAQSDMRVILFKRLRITHPI